MKRFDHVIIGFGKGGKTLAGALAAQGLRVALVEQSPCMYGGTCINVGCIPTKALEHRARLWKNRGGTFAEKAQRYYSAIQDKRALTASLREKNLNKLTSAGVEVFLGTASFGNAHRLLISEADGSTQSIEGEHFFINTGSQPFLPPISGLQDCPFVYTSETIMELDSLPESMVIIGGGYIGLEFASYYTNFGSEVTVVQDIPQFLPREDAEIAQSVLDSLRSRGVQVLLSTKVLGISTEKDAAQVTVQDEAGTRILPAQAILVATGRRPNVDALHLERAGVARTESGAVAVDEHLRTSAPHIYAMGDVTGGLQFTYISLDDFRIVKSQLLGDGSRTTQNRGEIPYSVFLDPPFSRVGRTEQQALEQGYSIKIARLPAAAIPKAQVIANPTGLLKVIVDSKTDLILGAHLFCAESHEIINLLKLAMDAKLPYSLLRDAVYTHPTMTEALNDLFSGI